MKYIIIILMLLLPSLSLACEVNIEILNASKYKITIYYRGSSDSRTEILSGSKISFRLTDKQLIVERDIIGADPWAYLLCDHVKPSNSELIYFDNKLYVIDSNNFEKIDINNPESIEHYSVTTINSLD